MFTFTINVKFILLSLIIIFIIFTCGFIIFVVCSYLIFKMLKSTVDINSILFYDYNKKTKRILNAYGDNIITNIYLIRQPISVLITFVLNICTFYNYNKLITEMKHYIPYHTLIMFEIKQQNNMKKLLLLEKNNSITMNDNFNIHKFQEIKHIKIKKKYTLNSILKTTQDRIGVNNFFNWNLCDNNCQKFTKEFLVTLNKYNKDTHDYIFSDKLISIIKPTEFALHTLNCICNVYNICEKYIYDF